MLMTLARGMFISSGTHQTDDSSLFLHRAPLDARYREDNEQTCGCRALEVYH
jgi:hypothetical protein